MGKQVPFTDEERLEAFVAKVDKRGSDECWEWKASKSVSGYGQFTAGEGHSTRAHRYSWELFFGPIPEGKLVLHKCDNPSCVNPYHLYLGDSCDNAEDAVVRGRHVAPLQKLYRTDIDEIRELLSQGYYNVASLAKLYKVHWSTIYRILKRYNYEPKERR